MRFLSRFGLGALVSFLVSSLIALASYSSGLWLGRNGANLLGIIYGSIPLALLLGMAAVVHPRRKVGQQGRPLVAVLIGAVLGFLYTLIFVRFRHVIPAFLVLMLSCWVPSGVSAMIAATSSKRLSAVIGIATLSLAAILLTEPAFNAFAHNQQMTVAFITPSETSTTQLEANPETLGFGNSEEIQIAKNEVLERVRALGFTETFRVLSITRWGKGRKSLVILVIRAPITKEVVLITVTSHVLHSEQESCEIRFVRCSAHLMFAVQVYAASQETPFVPGQCVPICCDNHRANRPNRIASDSFEQFIQEASAIFFAPARIFSSGLSAQSSGPESIGVKFDETATLDSRVPLQIELFPIVRSAKISRSYTNWRVVRVRTTVVDKGLKRHLLPVQR
jgi:hypothetical protein